MNGATRDAGSDLVLVLVEHGDGSGDAHAEQCKAADRDAGRCSLGEPVGPSRCELASARCVRNVAGYGSFDRIAEFVQSSFMSGVLEGGSQGIESPRDADAGRNRRAVEPLSYVLVAEIVDHPRVDGRYLPDGQVRQGPLEFGVDAEIGEPAVLVSWVCNVDPEHDSEALTASRFDLRIALPVTKQVSGDTEEPRPG